MEIRQVSSNNSGSCTQWRLVDAGKQGYFRLENRNSGKWMKTKECSDDIGTPIMQVTTNQTGGCTMWRLRDASASAPALSGATTTNGLGTDLESPGNELTIQAFPNPSAGEFTLRLGGTDRGPIKLPVVNLRRQVLREFEPMYMGTNGLPLDLTDLPSGVYVVSVAATQGAVARVRAVVR